MGAAQSCLRPQAEERQAIHGSKTAAAVESPHVRTVTAVGKPVLQQQQQQQPAASPPSHAVEDRQDSAQGCCSNSNTTTASTSTPATTTAVITTGSGSGSGAAAAAAAVQPLPLQAKLAVSPPSKVDMGQSTTPWLPYNPHFHGPPRPPCDDQRLEVANQLAALLDASPKKELENILRLVQGIFRVEAALIALFGDRRVYIINSAGGFKEGDFPWRWSFCGWTMASEQHSVMVINDAAQDARFHDNEVANKLGVRFYCGAPLVSSNGHRLGTLCFADTAPRVFDTSSLQILCNFSELVTRELEKDIALAQQQAAQAKQAKSEKVVQYELLLRTIDCVTSAVLLVDTTKPVWPVLYANSSWQQLVKRGRNAHDALLNGLRAQHDVVNNGGGNTNSSSTRNSADSNSSSNQGFAAGSVMCGSRHLGFLAEPTTTRRSDGGSSRAAAAAAGSPAAAAGGGGGAAAAAAAAASDPAAAGSSSTGGAGETGETGGEAGEAGGGADADVSSSGSSSIVGQSLWSLVDPSVLSQLGGSGGSSGSGSGSSGSSSWAPSDQVLQQVQARQSFTLRGVRLSQEFGGPVAQLTFRCAGFSTLDGGVSICLPTFAPDNSELPAAAAALSASSGTSVPPTDTHSGSLYFVTVKLHALPRSTSSGGSSKLRSSCYDSGSLWTGSNNTVSNAGSRQLPALVPCQFPQFADGEIQGLGNGGPTLVLNRGGCSADGGGAAAAAAAGAGLVVVTSVPAAAGAGSSSSSSRDSSSSSLPAVAEEGGAAAAEELPSSRNSNSSNSSCFAGSVSSSCSGSITAGLVCRRIAGLRLGGQIAAGSYGRVYRGEYFGSKVAVKVLDGRAVIRRDEATGFCLEALLSEGLRHPNIVRTLAWAVVTGEGQLPERQQVWGETLDPSKPSIAQNRAHAAGAGAGSGGGGSGGAPVSSNNGHGNGSNGNTTQQLLQTHRASSETATSSVDGTVSIMGPPEADKVTDNMTDNMSAEEQLLSSQLEAAEGDGARSENDVMAGQTWMVMEYCDKGCLQDAVERGWLRESRSCVSGRLNMLAVLATAAEIAAGMALLHNAGIVHGDLSAYNIMLSSADPAAAVGGRGFVAKVADFGLARTLNHGSKVITKTYGTLTHMPPEMLEHGLASKAADVYSFGVLMWQMVTGSRAWAGLSHMAVVDAVCCRKQQLQFPDGAPEALAMLGEACMAFNPSDRPTFTDVLDILAPLNSLLQSGGDGCGGCDSFEGAPVSDSRSNVMLSDAAASGSGGGGGGDGDGVGVARCSDGERQQQQRQQWGGASYVSGF